MPAWSSEGTATPTPPPWTDDPLPPGLNVCLSPSTTFQVLQLQASLPHVPEVTVVDGRILWTGAHHALPITGIDPITGYACLGSVPDPVRVPLFYVAEHDTAILDDLPDLMRQAQAAHLGGSWWHVSYDALLGTTLRTTGLIIAKPGILRRETMQAPDRAGDLDAVRRAAEALAANLPLTGLDSIARQALQNMLGSLDLTDDSEPSGEITPSLARRLVRHGYLRQWSRDAIYQIQVRTLEQAVERSVRMQTTISYSGAGCHLQAASDAFDTHIKWYSTAQLRREEYTETPPDYIGQSHAFQRVIIDLPITGNDAAPPPPGLLPIAARAYDRGYHLLCSWTAEGGLTTDLARWNADRGTHANLVLKQANPPHILLEDPTGDVLGLVVDQGVLLPMRTGGSDEFTRFMRDAAAMLPDAGHLDLIGEYLSAYAYPSPDARHPSLVGDERLHTDVERTAAQTGAEVAGGKLRGNCVELAEIYQDIARIQQRNPLIMGLPSHAACCWARAQGGGWRVELLQTGPPLAAEGPTLGAALEALCTNFDPNLIFDPEQVRILLRFGDENCYSSSRMESRIFTDPAYFAAMSEVQQERHFGMWLHAIPAITRLVAAGDRSEANYRELIHAYGMTGQFTLAAATCQEAQDQAASEEARTMLKILSIHSLLEAGQVGQAAAVANQVQILLTAQAADPKAPNPYRPLASLVTACLNDFGSTRLLDSAQGVLTGELTRQTHLRLTNLAEYLTGRYFDQDFWNRNPSATAQRADLSRYVTSCEWLLYLRGPQAASDPALKGIQDNLRQYFQTVAFSHDDGQGLIMEQYASLGWWYLVQKGEAAFISEIERIPAASDGAIDHAKRGEGPAQEAQDLSWIRASAPFWFDLISDQFCRWRGPVDRARISHLADDFAVAVAATEALTLDTPKISRERLLVRQLVALLDRNLSDTQAVFADIGASHDASTIDEAASWIGSIAPLLDPDWFGQVMGAWRSAVADQPSYLTISWGAALSQAPAQALLAATMAARTYPHDAMMVEEAARMQRMLQPSSEAMSSSAPHPAPTPASR